MAETPLGYKTGVKSAVVTSLQSAMPGVQIGIEYPMVKGEYPYIYVEFKEDVLGSVGIGHSEIGAVQEVDGESVRPIARRWKFNGRLSFGFFALKAKERDVLTDSFISAVGFHDSFKDAISGNAYIPIDVNTEQINPEGDSVSPGTPWGTDDMVYYASYSLDTVGEFYTDVDSAGIIRAVDIFPRTEDEPDLPDNTEGSWE
jgi:hypothetical protein